MVEPTVSVSSPRRCIVGAHGVGQECVVTLNGDVVEVVVIATLVVGLGVRVRSDPRIPPASSVSCQLPREKNVCRFTAASRSGVRERSEIRQSPPDMTRRRVDGAILKLAYGSALRELGATQTGRSSPTRQASPD